MFFIFNYHDDAWCHIVLFGMTRLGDAFWALHYILSHSVLDEALVDVNRFHLGQTSSGPTLTYTVSQKTCRFMCNENLNENCPISLISETQFVWIVVASERASGQNCCLVWENMNSVGVFWDVWSPSFTVYLAFSARFSHLLLILLFESVL